MTFTPKRYVLTFIDGYPMALLLFPARYVFFPLFGPKQVFQCHDDMAIPEQLHFHFSLSCIGEGNGNPLQCSCLENPRDRGAWWAAVYGVTQSWTRLKQLSSSSVYIGEGNGTPHQYSCLENPMDGEAWWAAVHGVAELDTTE